MSIRFFFWRNCVCCAFFFWWNCGILTFSRRNCRGSDFFGMELHWFQFYGKNHSDLFSILELHGFIFFIWNCVNGSIGFSMKNCNREKSNRTQFHDGARIAIGKNSKQCNSTIAISWAIPRLQFHTQFHYCNCLSNFTIAISYAIPRPQFLDAPWNCVIFHIFRTF